jgi:hypothetical protein
MMTLGEDEHARIVRNAMVQFLQTDEGLKLVKENQSPHFRYAQGMSEGEEDEG